jgi:hypothetical protein
MNISDPSLWPAQFGPMRFEHIRDPLDGGEVILMTSHGDVIAELSPGDDPETARAIEQHTGCPIARGRSWLLDVLFGAGSVIESHVLHTVREQRVGGEPLTGELAAWATLTVLWATTSRAAHQG